MFDFSSPSKGAAWPFQTSQAHRLRALRLDRDRDETQSSFNMEHIVTDSCYYHSSFRHMAHHFACTNSSRLAPSISFYQSLRSSNQRLAGWVPHSSCQFLHSKGLKSKAHRSWPSPLAEAGFVVAFLGIFDKWWGNVRSEANGLGVQTLTDSCWCESIMTLLYYQ